MDMFIKFLADESGASSMQYGLVALLVSVVAIAVMGSTGDEVNKLYVDVDDAVTGVAEK